MDRVANVPTRKSLQELQEKQSELCLSLYQPSHRHFPDNKQDPIRYKNLVNKLADSLKQKHSEEAVKKLLRPFQDLADDLNFWNHTLDGVAVFATENYFVAYTMPRTMPELAIVANSFHKKPLQKFLQSTDQYQLLALSLDEIEIYQGDRNSLQRIDPGPDVPKTIGEALGRDIEPEHRPPPQAYAATRGSRVVVTFGTGGGKDEREIDQQRWFRAVDSAIHEHISKVSQLPLVLVALNENQGGFRKLSQNSYLQPEGVVINPKAVKEDELKTLAWKVMEPQYHAYLDGMKDNYKVAASQFRGSDNIEEIAKAAVQGQVDTLFIQEDKLMPGTLDANTGAIERRDLAEPNVDDLLDDIGALVESRHGKVFLIPAKHMPSTTGVAAIMRPGYAPTPA